MSTTAILDRLVAFDTVSHKSNLDLVAYVEDLLLAAGARLTRLPSPCGQKAALYAEIGPEVAGGLLLSAHTDVVPTEGQSWSKPPFALQAEGDKLFGRGTTDMKGFVASALALAQRVQHLPLARPLAIVLSYDEEIGCVGLQEIGAELAPLLKAPALCVVGEPTEMQVAIGHKGKTAYQAVFRGEAGHSALAPHFRNALHGAADFLTALRDLQDSLAQSGPFDASYGVPYTTIHAGTLSGGTALNIVPDRAVMRFEIRNLAQQDMAALSAALEALVSTFAGGTQPSQMELVQTNTYPGLDVDPGAAWVRTTAEAAGCGVTKVAFGTEAGLLSAMGHNTLVCGPGSMEGQGHKADEYIHASQLAACDRFLDRLVAQHCRP